MNIKREFVMREIAGETVLVPVGTSSLDMNGLAVINEVGTRLWELLPDAEDVDDLVTAIMEEYDADEETVRADIEEFLQKLERHGIV